MPKRRLESLRHTRGASHYTSAPRVGSASASSRSLAPPARHSSSSVRGGCAPRRQRSWQPRCSCAPTLVIDLPATKREGKVPDTLTITDNRTGKTYEVPITDETIRAIDLRKIKVHDDDFGLMTYDPAFMNTASCRSSITFIDGDKGILEYRGYPIEQLAEKATHLQPAYLLIYGELPNKHQLDDR